MAFANTDLMKKIRFFSFSRSLFILAAGLFLALPLAAEIIRFHTIGRDGKVAADEPFFTEKVQAAVDEIDALQLAPVQVHVLVVPVSGGASFDYGKIVYIPRTLEHSGQYGGVYPKTLMDVLAVFAHEYGHAVFGKFLEEKFPLYAELRRLKNEMSDLELQKIQPGLDENTMTANRNRFNELKLLTERNPELIRIARQVSAYSELYSDAVAVFLYGRSAIYDALSYDDMPFHYGNYVETRDFGRRHEASTWSYSDEHALFSPLRSVLGDEACWPRNHAEKRLRLSQLQEVLMESLQAKVAQGALPGPRDNLSLIEAFRRFCR